MSKNRVLITAITAIALLGTLAPLALSADDTPAPTPAPQQQGGGRGGDFRERMNTFMKNGLGATDDEWKVLQPKIEKVMSLRMQAGGMGGMMGGGRGRRGGGGEGGGAAADAPARPQSESSKAAQDLRTALDDKSSSVDVIKAKLDTLRQARAKAKEEMAAAQKDLQSVVSVKQEAFLVMLGTLE